MTRTNAKKHRDAHSAFWMHVSFAVDSARAGDFDRAIRALSRAITKASTIAYLQNTNRGMTDEQR